MIAFLTLLAGFVLGAWVGRHMPRPARIVYRSRWITGPADPAVRRELLAYLARTEP